MQIMAVLFTPYHSRVVHTYGVQEGVLLSEVCCFWTSLNL